ncbi:glycine/betaine ABC transporter ATP-binding protein [Mesobacillus campisalis]|uniref:Quaternary amine transport ATP-binding protein n=1 Tax=Mesobacillus campisalis TaxID=1408103 RepID=A0A0M2T5G5_9BACI|nr:ABC transporter ATP-binding protein [Mesobacillus campisalis]KKK40060.1 glycine/betaine ABC transporter ATP-binding protein [Mesobacillus campisalis]
MITFNHVTKSYSQGTKAVDSISFEIKKGEFFVLIGPSGCGKTTSLKMINRLIPLSDGTIYINGKRISDYEVNELRWNIGYVLQQIALFPHMTIEENIAVVPEMKGWSAEKIKTRVTELLEMVGLDPDTYRNRKPSQLSGGEQQRVGVIRALAADPDIILMDEPFSALDPISREKLQDDIIHLQKTIRKTIVFVTHDMQEAIKLADRICLMKDGKIVQLGTPEEIMNHPANDFVRDFVGSKKSGGDFNLEEFLRPLDEQDRSPAAILPATASLEEVARQLSTYEELHVEKNGQIIGMVNRQMIVQYFSQHLEERGTSHV